LDRFDQLPFNSICELSKERFMKLIGNINVSATKSYLFNITHEWMNHHHDFTVPFNIIENKKAKMLLPCIISCEHNNGEQYIHCWDGNDFFELTSFDYPPDIIERCSKTGKSLEGMQITGKGYDLYLCGGEYGIDSGIFNKNIWRYSLISKKWILETEMPVERKHMITVCLKNKLLLVGGVGRNKQKLKTFDIYDIYTGNFNSAINYYFPDKNVWKYRPDPHPFYSSFVPSVDVPILTLQIMLYIEFTLVCFADVIDQEEMALKTITDTCNVKGCNRIMQTLLCSKYARYERYEEIIDPELRYCLFCKIYGYSFVESPPFCE
ncbi:uncharacterized protein LOC112451649, partial [Temnothorax curvispinosus]|uniref:Uncharacterized protein LOC112451649 n=1 Tax=Temnothorax curvispinosus TaxID=300111 RepID=A0A6J1PCE0_9HYME